MISGNILGQRYYTSLTSLLTQYSFCIFFMKWQQQIVFWIFSTQNKIYYYE